MPRRATSGSSTPTWLSSARTRSSAASTASRSTTSATRPTRCCAARSCARAVRATPPSTALNTATCCSCPSRRRGAAIDCGTQGAPGAVNPERFRGVRIFDISDIDNPVQLPGVQTCRGSHTHTIVTDPDDPDNIYIYNSGTAGVRSPLELAGCENAALTDGPSDYRQPDPVAHRCHQGPAGRAGDGVDRQPAADLHRPGHWRFQRAAEHAPRRAAPVGHALLAAAQHEHLPRRQRVPGDRPARRRVPGQRRAAGHLRPGESGAAGRSLRPELLLLALRTVQQRRHQGDVHRRVGRRNQRTLPGDRRAGVGSRRPVRHRRTGKMEFASYYKMPAVQTVNENCVAHNSSVIPVPNRDIYVQAWYQGGVSVVDFTDTANPVEIAFFDRGPINSPFPIPDPTNPNRTQPGRPLVDVLVQRLHLRHRDRPWLRHVRAGAERAADRQRDRGGQRDPAGPVQLPADVRAGAAPSFAVVLANLDQVVRAGDIDAKTADKVRQAVDKAEKLADKGEDASARGSAEQCSSPVGRSLRARPT